MAKSFIAVDWGTTSFRAYRVGAEGEVQDEVAAPDGILAVTDGDFDGALERRIEQGDDTRIVGVRIGMHDARQRRLVAKLRRNDHR